MSKTTASKRERYQAIKHEAIHPFICVSFKIQPREKFGLGPKDKTGISKVYLPNGDVFLITTNYREQILGISKPLHISSEPQIYRTVMRYNNQDGKLDIPRGTEVSFYPLNRISYSENGITHSQIVSQITYEGIKKISDPIRIPKLQGEWVPPEDHPDPHKGMVYNPYSKKWSWI